MLLSIKQNHVLHTCILYVYIGVHIDVCSCLYANVPTTAVVMFDVVFYASFYAYRL